MGPAGSYLNTTKWIVPIKITVINYTDTKDNILKILYIKNNIEN